ncbi:hypothetical protein IB642_00830 [Allofrancisella guangzhouensis]|nr:carbohydrate-binding protein [Allofrancisella guangzhouensis]MBK2027336.1 hypothetical protein [Allofrancisella guangzhouensis]MBK2043561.1 hypothetical protein [Allofrancisella guangzhouensis]MBK2045875.1 hypothetical protein [Allofrancisella guangzhouensis]
MKKKLSLWTSFMLVSFGISDAAAISNVLGEQEEPLVSAYYLGDSDSGSQWASLERFQTLANEVTEQGTNFNKLILSFVQPSLFYYQSGSLAGTGLFGYFIDRNWSSEKIINFQKDSKAREDFQRLKNIISQFERSGVHVYLAVGGWNFSCDPNLYTQSLNALGQQTPRANMCGPEDGLYDTFPNPIPENTQASAFENYKRGEFEDPASSQQANVAYENLVKLANDLGASGIDLDYEEFWHADLNSYSLSTLLNNKWQIKDFVKDGDISYQQFRDLMKSMGISNQLKNVNGQVQGEINTGNPGAMPETVDKFAAIIKTVHDNIQKINPDLKLSAALPAVGAVPTNVLAWSSSDHLKNGSPWYYGNLKGLMYNVAYKDESIAKDLDALSVMSYDLSKSDGQYLNGAQTLADQVKYYMDEYYHFLGAASDTSTKLNNQTIIPGTFDLDRKIQFGFEIGQPAYPTKETGNAFALSIDEMTEILKSEAQSGRSVGMIMWDLYKDQRYDKDYLNYWDSNWPTPKDVLQATCKAFNLGSNLAYNCDANVPDNKVSPSFGWESNLKATSIGQTTAEIFWVKPDIKDQASYTILLNNQKIAENVVDLNYSLSGLEKATKYNVTVIANIKGYESQSASISFNTEGQCQAKSLVWVYSPVVSSITTNSAKASWQAEVRDTYNEAISYGYKLKDAGGDVIFNGVGTSVEFVNLEANTNYTLIVTASAEGYDSISNSESFTTEQASENTWDSNKIYNKGDKVIYKGIEYTAKWWTQGDIPANGGPWEKPYVSGGEWNSKDIYTTGQTAKYQGHTYEAKWWTQGNTPSNGDPWKKVD